MSSRDVKIFLVEDDLSFGSVLKSYLEINDFQVEWVDDGKYAVDHFRRGIFISASSMSCFRMSTVSLLPGR
jgi:DNA-binding NtrC family response regulator